MTLLGKMGLVLVMLVGAQWCIHPQEHPLTPGQLLAFVLLVNMLYEPIARLHGVNQMMVSGLASAQRVFAVLDQSGEEDLQHGIAVERLQGAIEFREVAFAYQPQRPIVQSLSISIKPFQTVAFVGATGSGKSTIFQLITGFYTANSGSITIDEHPIEQLAKAALRNNIAYVTQDAFLFATDIRQNLLLGKPGASDEELWHALKLACADEFVARLPDGLNSQVGERGNRLSGGERQRLYYGAGLFKMRRFYYWMKPPRRWITKVSI